MSSFSDLQIIGFAVAIIAYLVLPGIILYKTDL